MPTRSGGRYVLQDGTPVLVQRSGDPRAKTQPEPSAPQPVEDATDEDPQETPARRAGK